MAYATINKPDTYFNTVTYTGTGSNQTISVGFTPDFWWLKSRSGATNNRLYNQVTSGGYLVSNSTTAQVTSGTVGQTTGGFIVGTDGVNTNGATYVAWNWLANGSGSSNTQGSITSTVSANTTSGFSIVSYTGNGTGGATIGHGLGAVPKMIIVKNRDDGGSYWHTYNSNIGNSNILYLNLTDASGAASSWNSTTPTSSVFTVGNGSAVNGSSQSHIAYCFAEVKGFSKFGSYTGNGSSGNGTFVYTGFKPAFILIKRTDAVANWFMYDTKRNIYNASGQYGNYLWSNSSQAEAVGGAVDFYSNGFKLFTSWSELNASGGTYIYMAFAEQSLVGTNNVPATAR